MESALTQIRNLINDARNSSARNDALRYIDSASILVNQFDFQNSPEGFILYFDILCRKTDFEATPSKRKENWLKAIKYGLLKCQQNFKSNLNVLIKITDRLLDGMQDFTIKFAPSEANFLLHQAIELLDQNIIDKGADASCIALYKKASALRIMSKFQSSKTLKQQMSDRAIRCAERSTRADENNPFAHLAHGLTLWNHAQYQKTDLEYTKYLEEADAALQHSVNLDETEYSLLAFCQFYRSTNQPDRFLDVFKIYKDLEPYKRKYLESAGMYSEVVLHLFYQKFGNRDLTSYFNEAVTYLNEAIAAGFNDARNIINLCFIYAAMGQVPLGHHTIRKLFKAEKEKSWNEVLAEIPEYANEDDLFKKGFASGIDDPFIINKLGTFFYSFLKDNDTAIEIYEHGLRLDKNNRVILTNLARVLSFSESSDDIYYALGIMKRIESNFIPGFKWWRVIRANIQRKINEIEGDVSVAVLSVYKGNKENLSDLYKRFLFLKENEENRGNLFNELIKDLLELSFGTKNIIGSHRFVNRYSSERPEIDAAWFDKDCTKFELKWEKAPSTPNDIGNFFGKIERVANTKGVFISMAGYTRPALDRTVSHRKEAEIILMDGEELEIVLNGSITLGEMISQKRKILYKTGEPYAKVTGMSEDSIFTPESWKGL